MNDISVILGKNIKRLREERGLLQKNVANSCGITSRTLSLIEKGKQKNPGIQTVIKLGEILEVNIEDLFIGKLPKSNMQVSIDFEKLNSDNKKLVRAFMKFCMEQQNNVH